MWLSGCYTQFRTLEERYPAPPPKVSDETRVDDSTVVETDSLEEKDTVVIKEREVCYWERTFFGDWELRCYESNYSDYWHRYYNRPWWYRSYNYNAYDCHCPYHTFYHPNCEYCWYYCDNYHHYGYGNHMYIHHIHDSSGSSTGSMSTGSPGKAPVKMKSVGSGRKGSSSKSKKKPVGPAPTTSPSVPKKNPDGGKVPDKKIINTGKSPAETETNTSKPEEPRRRSRKKRFGRGR